MRMSVLAGARSRCAASPILIHGCILPSCAPGGSRQAAAACGGRALPFLFCPRWRSDFLLSWTGATREVDGCDAGCRGGLLPSGGWRHPWQVRLGQPCSLCPGHARLWRPLAARLAVASRHACARPCMCMDASACVCSRCATSPVLARAWIHRGCVPAGCSRAEASRGGRAGLARPRAHAHPCVARFMTYFLRCGRT